MNGTYSDAGLLYQDASFFLLFGQILINKYIIHFGFFKGSRPGSASFRPADFKN